MRILRKEHAPRYKRPEGIQSYLLASPRTCDASHLTTTLVEIQSGGEQRIHSHAVEQIYYILEGSGVMTVGGETEQVRAGECVFIPSGAPHGLKNNGRGVLRYFSAAAPAIGRAELDALWPLSSETEERT